MPEGAFFNSAAGYSSISALPKPTFRKAVSWEFAWLRWLIALQEQPHNHDAENQTVEDGCLQAQAPLIKQPV
jgi:hypothetical protein